MSTTTYKRYDRMILDICQRPITEREIISAKSALRNGSHEVRCLLESHLLYDGGTICDITPEQTAKGTVWCRKNMRRKFQLEDHDIVMGLQGFKFCGFYMQTGLGFYPSFLPVYRMLGLNGLWLDYCYDFDKIHVFQRSRS